MSANHEHSHEETVTARALFSQRPCICVRNHSPQPLEVELHHPWPQEDQKRQHGRLVERQTVALCDTAHKNVHVALRRRIAGVDVRLGNRYLQGLVEYALSKRQAQT